MIINTIKIKALLSKKPNIYALIVLITGTICSLLIYKFMLQKEKSVVYEKYLQRAEVHTKDIEAEFKRSFLQVSSVANLFSSSGWVTYAEFSEFVNRVLPNLPEGRRVTALHYFSSQKSKEIISKIKENPEPQFNNFSIFNFTPPNNISTATPTDNHYTVASYTFPEIKTKHFIGRNIVPTSVIGPLIYPVIHNKTPLISNFSQPVENIRNEPFLLYLYPILSKQTLEPTVDGLIVSSQYLSDFFVHNVTGNGPTYFNYILIDKNGNQFSYPNNQLINKADVQQPQKRLQFNFPLELGNNQFELIIIPNDQELKNTSNLLFELLISGLLLTLALAFITRSLLSQQSYLAEEIKRKTLAIDKQKKQLYVQNFQLMDAVNTAEVSAKAKSDFLANMSHEIRTPLNGVIGLTQLLKQTKLDEQQQEYIDKLTFSGKHLLSVINDILDFSKIESGKIVLEQTPFSIYSVIDNLNMLFKKEAEAKGL